jgi:hypothetical protein
MHIIYEWKCDECGCKETTVDKLVEHCPDCSSFKAWWIVKQTRIVG